MPLQSHQTHSITFIRYKMAFCIASLCLPDCFHVCLCWTLLYRIHFPSPITNWSKISSLLNSLSKEMAAEIYLILFFSVSKWGTHISSFKSNPVFFKRWKLVDQSTLNTVATSVVICRYWELRYTKHLRQYPEVDHSMVSLQG